MPRLLTSTSSEDAEAMSGLRDRGAPVLSRSLGFSSVQAAKKQSRPPRTSVTAVHWATGFTVIVSPRVRLRVTL